MSASPLKRIHTWFALLPTEVKNELAASMTPLHPNINVRAAVDDVTAVGRLEKYMLEESITYNEIIARSLVMIGLIDYCTHAKNSRMYWRQLEEALIMIEELLVAHLLPYANKDDMVATFHMRKRAWLGACRDWSRLKLEFLQSSDIAAFEQHMMVDVIKSGSDTPYHQDLYDSAHISCLPVNKPDAMASYYLLRKCTDRSTHNRPSIFLHAPFSRAVLNRKWIT